MSFLSEDENGLWGLFWLFVLLVFLGVGMWIGIETTNNDLTLKPFVTYSNGYVVNKGFLEVSRDAGFNYFKCLTWFNGKQYFDFNCMKAVDAQKKKEYFNTAID